MARSTVLRFSYCSSSKPGGRPPRDPLRRRAAWLSTSPESCAGYPDAARTRGRADAVSLVCRDAGGLLRGRPRPRRGTRIFSSTGTNCVQSARCPATGDGTSAARLVPDKVGRGSSRQALDAALRARSLHLPALHHPDHQEQGELNTPALRRPDRRRDAADRHLPARAPRCGRPRPQQGAMRDWAAAPATSSSTHVLRYGPRGWFSSGRT